MAPSFPLPSVTPIPAPLIPIDASAYSWCTFGLCGRKHRDIVDNESQWQLRNFDRGVSLKLAVPVRRKNGRDLVEFPIVDVLVCLPKTKKRDYNSGGQKAAGSKNSSHLKTVPVSVKDAKIDCLQLIQS